MRVGAVGAAKGRIAPAPREAPTVFASRARTRKIHAKAGRLSRRAAVTRRSLDRQIQPGREFAPNKSKQNQTNPNKNACFCLDLFGGIGTFQGVTREKSKKNFPAPNSRAGLCEERLGPRLARTSRWEAGPLRVGAATKRDTSQRETSVHQTRIARFLIFVKEMEPVRKGGRRSTPRSPSGRAGVLRPPGARPEGRASFEAQEPVRKGGRLATPRSPAGASFDGLFGRGGGLAFANLEDLELVAQSPQL